MDIAAELPYAAFKIHLATPIYFDLQRIYFKHERRYVNRKIRIRTKGNKAPGDICRELLIFRPVKKNFFYGTYMTGPPGPSGRPVMHHITSSSDQKIKKHALKGIMLVIIVPMPMSLSYFFACAKIKIR